MLWEGIQQLQLPTKFDKLNSVDRRTPVFSRHYLFSLYCGTMTNARRRREKTAEEKWESAIGLIAVMLISLCTVTPWVPKLFLAFLLYVIFNRYFAVLALVAGAYWYLKPSSTSGVSEPSFTGRDAQQSSDTVRSLKDESKIGAKSSKTANKKDN